MPIIKKARYSITPSWVTTYVEIYRRIDSLLSQHYKLTLTQYRILLELLPNSLQLRNQDLAKSLLLRPSSITSALNRLEVDRFIIKKNGLADRRTILIALSESGRQLADNASKMILQMLQNVWSSLNSTDINLIIESTRSISSQMHLSQIEAIEAPVQPFYVTSIVTVVERYKRLIQQISRLSMTEFRILFELKTSASILGGKDLARLLFMHPSVISVSIQKLIEQDFIVQESDTGDRRNSCYALSMTGEQIVAVAIAGLEEETAMFYREFNLRQFALLVDTADVIVANLRAITL